MILCLKRKYLRGETQLQDLSKDILATNQMKLQVYVPWRQTRPSVSSFCAQPRTLCQTSLWRWRWYLLSASQSLPWDMPQTWPHLALCPQERVLCSLALPGSPSLLFSLTCLPLLLLVAWLQNYRTPLLSIPSSSHAEVPLDFHI